MEGNVATTSDCRHKDEKQHAGKHYGRPGSRIAAILAARVDFVEVLHCTRAAVTEFTSWPVVPRPAITRSILPGHASAMAWTPSDSVIFV
eukprot:589468-Prymnesium_polylepis.5